MSKKKTILITGGSDGLGLSLAKSLVNDNNVIILSKTEEKLKKVAEEINCDYTTCDIRNSEQVEKIIESLINKYQNIDVLINSAGVWCCDELVDNSYRQIEDLITTNLLGTMYITKSVIPYMKDNKKGMIININSQLGIKVKEERVPYVTSKWGMTGFTRSLQKELEKYGIKVTDVMADRMKTNLFIKNGINKEPSGLELEEVVKLISFIIEMDEKVYIPEVGIKTL